ncbi:hypothetical protein A8E25_14240 [Burkholderia cenocepacia]|nr:hypothetical protein BURCENK562V_C7317 [Burkholderia cenocepacia K56-2Valvano]ONR54244.1 hypothetical protein A8E17_25390 [Burkholderia cenocepacia]ONR67992.1 hypothetical protein A8E18_22345 [Burkholderia cenocepacia]ONR75186.1 hypothetical protein A8E22_26000 [Burkholderia cenocepacia]ONR77507.1 hypothetical protein A8E23_04005 [Burkholderia cenocepacia]
MPAGAAHGPQGLDLRGSSSTATILYIHTVFHDDPAGIMDRRRGIPVGIDHPESRCLRCGVETACGFSGAPPCS